MAHGLAVRLALPMTTLNAQQKSRMEAEAYFFTSALEKMGMGRMACTASSTQQSCSTNTERPMMIALIHEHLDVFLWAMLVLALLGFLMRELLLRERPSAVLGKSKSTFEFVSIDKAGASHAFMFGQTQYGMRQTPVGGHKPITIIEVEDGAVPCDTRCDGSLDQVTCDSCKSKH